MTTNKILLVDDDENLLQSCRRNLRSRFNLTTARGPEDALGWLETSGPYVVVVSDLRMPGGMDGIGFLPRIQQAFPETVRIMLTGFADVQTAIDAVNKGHVFRFLTKPCPPEVLGRALQDGLQQHQLARSRFELLETQLRHAQKMESVGQCAACAVHDLNNMLASIRGCADLAATEPADSKDFVALLSHIRSGATHAARLTKQLVGLARRQSGPEFRTVFLKELLEDLSSMLRHIFSSRVQIEVRCAAELWPVNADETMLRQALLNLALNARDAMPNDGRLTFEVRPVERVRPNDRGRARSRPGRYACVSVSDTGCGMNAATTARIFEPFFTTKETNEGTGLGLSMAAEIVRTHGGWIVVESELSKGSTFRIFLPEWQAADANPERKQP